MYTLIQRTYYISKFSDAKKKPLPINTAVVNKLQGFIITCAAAVEVIGLSPWTETSRHSIMRDGTAQPYSNTLPVRILKLKKQTMRTANSRPQISRATFSPSGIQLFLQAQLSSAPLSQLCTPKKETTRCLQCFTESELYLSTDHFHQQNSYLCTVSC